MADLEYGFIRGPSVIARDICNMCITCKTSSLVRNALLEDLWIKIKIQRDSLTRCPRLNDDFDWRKLLSDPYKCTKIEIQSALKYLNTVRYEKQRVTQTKLGLITCLLQSFGLEISNLTCPQLLWEIQFEKHQVVGRWYTAIDRITGKLYTLHDHKNRHAIQIIDNLKTGRRWWSDASLFHIRKEVTTHFMTMSELQKIAWPVKGDKKRKS